MAGLVLELAASEGIAVPIEIVPGVTAASALAARLGAPLMCDFAVLSLSDLLVPWEQIRRRLEAVAAADLVVAIYNPRSQKRTRQLAEAAAIFRRHRPGTTPVGVGTALGSPEEQILLSDLDHFLELPIAMRSVVIIGNRSTRADRGVVCDAQGCTQDMILLIGGTSETAPLASGLAAAGYDVLVSTATDVPLAIGEHPRIPRRTGRLDEEGLVALAKEKGSGRSSTPPTPTPSPPMRPRERGEAPRRSPASSSGGRSATPDDRAPPPFAGSRSNRGDPIRFAADHAEAAALAFADGRPVLLTTGSRNLAPYAEAARRTGIPLRRPRPRRPGVAGRLPGGGDPGGADHRRPRPLHARGESRRHPAVRDRRDRHQGERPGRRPRRQTRRGPPGKLPGHRPPPAGNHPIPNLAFESPAALIAALQDLVPL